MRISLVLSLVMHGAKDPFGYLQLQLAESSKIFGVRHWMTDCVSNRNPKSLLGKWLSPIILNDPELLPFSAKWVLGEFQSPFLANQYLSKSRGPGFSKAEPPAPLLCCWGQHLWHMFVSAWRMQLCRALQLCPAYISRFFKLFPWVGYLEQRLEKVKRIKVGVY